ncbi:MAG: UDP-N-acetylmuramate--L-alanine ligase, partial [Thermoleophilia bacterium]|nr:UDP-N-acetylmuramate--L-alanine ligase [Thermoleophilia bacterium]
MTDSGTDTQQAAQPLAGRSFHMMGIGGAGVSALAQLADAWGARVTGCDNADSSFTALVRAKGIDVVLGHGAAHIDGGSELVVSSAVPVDHPERVRAGEVGVHTWLRGELLGELTQARSSVVI